MLYDKMMGIGSKVVKACAIILLGTGCNEHPAPAKTANDLERTLRAGGKLATISTEVKGKKLNSNLIDRTDAFIVSDGDTILHIPYPGRYIYDIDIIPDRNGDGYDEFDIRWREYWWADDYQPSTEGTDSYHSKEGNWLLTGQTVDEKNLQFRNRL